MKLLSPGWFACACLFASVALTGCGSPPQDPFFLSSPQPRSAAMSSGAGRQRILAPNGADVARFHVGDTVIVTFSGTLIPMDPHKEAIKEDGTITLPDIGPVYAVGKTAGELQTEIYNDYVPKLYVRLNVTVESGDRYFYVGGEIKGSGRQVYTDGLTLTKAIQTAGGLTDFANHKKVWIVRNGTGQRIKVNYDDALKNPAKDPPIYPDDQINVDKHW